MANSKSQDLPAHLHSLMRTFLVGLYFLQDRKSLKVGNNFSDQTHQPICAFVARIRYNVFLFFFCFFCFFITKTYLYNVDPLKPHFYIVKLGFTGDILYFNQGGSNEYQQSMF